MKLRDLLDRDQSLSLEGFLLLLVRSVRDDDEEEQDAGDVYRAARKRRRRLGILAFGAGPLVGVANQLADLYCETAVLSDVAALHDITLTDEEIGAHMLVLWDIAETWDEARAAIDGEPSVAVLVGRKLSEGARDRIPEELTVRSAIKALWDVRSTLGEAREIGPGAFKTVLFTGRRTKQVIARAEAQLGVGSAERTHRRLGPAD